MIFASVALTFLMVLLLVITPWAYTVQSGDTLSKIAAQYGTTADAIAALNGIENKDMIYVGQELAIPGSSDGYERTAISKKEEKALENIFDASFYASENPDVVATVGTDVDKLFEHYLIFGIWEARQPNEDFNVNAYASAYSDLRDAFGDEPRARQLLDYTLHYCNYGIAENREITTVEECHENNIEILYYGSYDDGAAETAYEAPIFKKAVAPAAPVATGKYLKDTFWLDVWNILDQTSTFLKDNAIYEEGDDVYDFIYGKPSEKNDLSTLTWFNISGFSTFGIFPDEDTEKAYDDLYDNLMEALEIKYASDPMSFTDFKAVAQMYTDYYIEYDKYENDLREDEPVLFDEYEVVFSTMGYCAGMYFYVLVEAFKPYFFLPENNFVWTVPSF